MNTAISDSARDTHARPYLALAGKEIQSSLRASDTPRLVEEILATRVTSAHEYLRDWAQPTVIWPS